MKKLLMATCAIACVSQGGTSESYASDIYVHINLSTIATSNTNKTDDNTEYKYLQAKWDTSGDNAELKSVWFDRSLRTMRDQYGVPPCSIHITADLPGKHEDKTVHLGTLDTARKAGAFSGLSYHNSHWRDPNDPLSRTKIFLEINFGSDGQPVVCYGSLNYLFYDSDIIQCLNFENMDTSKVTHMGFMFENCANLETINFGNFNTENVTYMWRMFYNCRSLEKLDLSSFNTKQVKNMGYMFCGCENLLKLTVGENFDTSNVRTMNGMFMDCQKIEELDFLKKFSTINVYYMHSMFKNCSALKSLDLSSFEAKELADVNWMFCNCNAKIQWGKFDIGIVCNYKECYLSSSEIEDIEKRHGQIIEEKKEREKKGAK